MGNPLTNLPKRIGNLTMKKDGIYER